MKHTDIYWKITLILATSVDRVLHIYGKRETKSLKEYTMEFRRKELLSLIDEEISNRGKVFNWWIIPYKVRYLIRRFINRRFYK